MERDIFEDVRSKVGCMFISDLPRSRDRVEKELLNLPLDQYSEKQVFDLCEYVFGKNNSVYKSLKDKTNE